MKKSIVLPTVLLHAALLRPVAPFAASTPISSPPWQALLDSILPSTSGGGSSDDKQRRSELKSDLLSECRPNLGRCTPEMRGRIESLIDELAPLNPTIETARSPLLKRKWILEWTSEKEINFFLEKGISDEITQALDGETLENYIPFVKGGGFGVAGEIGVDDDAEGGMRTRFKFENANLDLGRWGSYDFPPVGEGWFDTVYLDEELRVDTNSRDDILICRAE